MNYDATILLPGLTVGISTGLNAVLTRLGQRLSWCDPVGDPLKTHARPTPFLGGVGVFLVITGVSIALLGIWPAAWVGPAVALPPLAVGLWDDFRWKTATRAIPKLGLQLLAAVTAAAVLTALRLGPMALPTCMAAALAAALILGAMNAFNLADGMDGLCAGQSLLSAAGLTFVLRALGAEGPAALALALAGTLAGFLFLNWHPAQLFLGDGGSHLCGALLAGLAWVAAAHARTTHAFGGVVLLLGLPVLDTAATILRRVWHRRPLFRGDRGHVYDLLQQHGVPVPAAVLVLWLLHALLVAAGALLLLRGHRG